MRVEHGGLKFVLGLRQSVSSAYPPKAQPRILGFPLLAFISPAPWIGFVGLPFAAYYFIGVRHSASAALLFCGHWGFNSSLARRISFSHTTFQKAISAESIAVNSHCLTGPNNRFERSRGEVFDKPRSGSMIGTNQSRWIPAKPRVAQTHR